MFANVLNQITGRLDSRFILTLFFPSLVFWGGLIMVYYASLSGLEAAVIDWRAQNTDIQLIQIIIALAWVTFFAYLLSNQLVWLTKQFEGYWRWLPLIGRVLANMRQKHYQNVLKRLDESGQYQVIYYQFPFPNEPEEVMPTRLGNILKNSEQYAYQRYDMDAVLLWPRLYAVMPDGFRKTLDGARASLDFMLVVSALGTLFALIVGIYLILISGPWWLFLLCFVGGWIVAYLAYLSALEAALTYGQLIKSAFDLYRDALCQQLGYVRPKLLDEERSFWKAAYDLIYRGEVGHPDVLPDPVSNETQSSAQSEAVPVRSRSWLQKQDWQKGLATLLILFLAAAGAFYLRPPQQSVTTWFVPGSILYVPKADLPAYHLITAADLIEDTIPTANLLSGFLLQKAELVGRYTRHPLVAKGPVTEAQLVPRVDENYVAETTAVSIPATAAMTYNSQLTPGAIVRVWTVTDTGAAEPLLAEALVLDIQKAEGQSELADKTFPYVIVLAVPSAKQARLIGAVASGSLIITLTR